MTLYAKFVTGGVTPTSADFTYTSPTGRGQSGEIAYDGQPYTANIISTKSGMGTITVEYTTVQTPTEEDWTSTAPTNVNTYYVRANVTAGTSYSAAKITDAAWTFTINKGNQTVPTTPVGENTSADYNDGKITGVDSTMEYKTQSVTSYTAIATTELTELAADTYNIRYKGNDNYNPSPDKTVTIATLPTPIANTDLEFIAPIPSESGEIIYDGEQHSAIIKAADGKTGLGDVTVEYQLVETNNWTTVAPTDAGEYNVRAQVTKGTNYGKAVNVTANNWTFTINNAEQEAPINLEVTNETIAGAKDGIIKNVNDTMEYTTDLTGIWTKIENGQTTIEGLTPGVYYVRYQEKPNYNASEPTELVIKSGETTPVDQPTGNNQANNSNSVNTGDFMIYFGTLSIFIIFFSFLCIRLSRKETF